MLKTINFHFFARVPQILLVICLLCVCQPGAMAQESATKPARTPSTAEKAKGGTSEPPARVVTHSQASQTVVDPSVPGDATVLKMLEPYGEKVRALDVVIGKLDGELARGAMGAGTLGNFVTDGIRAQATSRLGAPIDLVVTNSGGLRKSAIAAGSLHVRDIFELLPFENALLELELTGDQLMKVLQIVVASRSPQSGARIKYRSSGEEKSELVSAVLVGADGSERPIEPAAKYRVITIDYLLNVTGGNFAIMQASKVQKPLGVTLRDALIEYVKAEAAAGRTIKAKLDGRFRREGQAGENNPQ